jgi:hypothetical protein
VYFERWFRAKNQPVHSLSDVDAKARHSAGEPYVVLLDISDEKRVLDIAGEWISVMFFDDNDRLYLKYDFKSVESKRLFLSLASHFEFKGDSVKPEVAITFAFHMNGSILIEKRNLASGYSEEKNSSGDIDSNWEMYPEFGCYNSISRLHRTSGIP